MRHRVEAAHARTDTREWAVKRRERTRHLIELGGLVVKSKLVELAGDDRAVIYGALLGAAYRLCEDDGEQMRAHWGRRGHRAFAAEAAEKEKREKG